jgi:hypothetical protein
MYHPNYKEIKKEAIQNTKTAILNTEEFLQKVKEGDTFFYITSWCGKPINIEKATFKKRIPKEEIDSDISDLLRNCERILIEFESSSDKTQLLTNETFVDDFFWSHKMVVLDEKEALLIFQNLINRFEDDEIWRGYYLQEKNDRSWQKF